MKKIKKTMRRFQRPLPVSALATMLALIPVSGWADTVSWSGGQSTDWSNDANWVWDGHAPGSSDKAVIDGITVTPVLSGTGQTAQLVVGGGSNGALTITGTLTSSEVLIGNSSGAVGTITVTDTGTAGSANFDSLSTMTIGNEGAGALTLENGAKSEVAGTAYVGIGATGSGTLSLTNGSSFSANTLHLGYDGGIGTVTIDASNVDIAGDTIINGGSLASTVSSVTLSNGWSWTNAAGSVTVGAVADGKLTIETGSTLTSNLGVIGQGSASNGLVVVDGQSSAWTIATTLYVGAAGNGTLNITNGGKVTSANTVIGRQGTSDSSVSVDGSNSILDAGALTIGGDATSGVTGGTGTLTVTDGGHVDATTVLLGAIASGEGTFVIDDATATLTNRMSVGYYGTGTLTVRNGATVSDTGALIGHHADSNGTATVTGTGSKWENTGVLYVGNEGNGTLTVEAGGTVTSTDGYVATENGSTSSATVTGANSVWTNSGDFFVGHNTGSVGTVTISDGGKISGVQGILGDLTGSSGTMTVTGANSTWSNTSDVNVGRFGHGDLTVSNGGQVTGNRAYIANEANSSGVALVTGTGSLWETTQKLHVGTEGDGTLTVSDGGTARAAEIYIAVVSGSTGVVNVGAAANATAAVAGILDTSSIRFGAGTGTLNLNHTATTSSPYLLAAVFSGSGTINQLAGATVFSGSSASFAGTTNINGGSLTVNGALGGNLFVNNGGLLTGTGAVGTASVASGGTIATFGTNTLTVNGNLALQSGSTYQVKTTDAGASGSLQVNGNAAIAGSNLSVLAGGGNYSAGTIYTILTTTGALSGTFANTTSDFAFVTPVVTYNSNNVQLSLVSNDNGYASVAGTGNQSNVANALSAAALQSSTTAAFRSVLAKIDVLSTEQAKAAFDSMSGRAHLGLATVGVLSNSMQTLGQRTIGSGGAFGSTGGTGLAMSNLMLASTETDRFDRMYTAATMTDSTEGIGGPAQWRSSREQGGFWGQVNGSRGNTRSDGNAAGYTNNNYGMLLGLDRVIDEQWRVGMAYNYANSRLFYKTAGDRAEIDAHQLAAYGSYENGPWRFKGVAAYGRNDYDTTRDIVIGSSVSRANAKFKGNEYGLYLESAYRIDRVSYLFEPVAGLQTTVLRQDAFSETGAGAVGLNVGSNTTYSAVSTLGARWHVPLQDGALKSEWRAFWSHQWLDTGSALRASFQGAPGVNFQLSGLQAKRDSLILGGGLAGKVGKNTTLFIDYNLGANSQQTQHNVVAGLRILW